MKSRNTRNYSRSGARDGLALIVVLAFIVLLTILVVSFTSFSGLNRLSTSSYSNSIQSQEIAEGGLEDVLNDLHNEIIAGSTNNSSAYVVNGVIIYVPAVNFTAVPARIGYASTSWGTDTTPTTLSPTLIRVSRATGNPKAPGGDKFFTDLASSSGYYANNIASVPGGTILNRASTNSAGTATPSVNGRLISPARWNKTFLLATNAATVPTPFTNAPPDWIYVTRTGSRVCNIATDTVGALLPSNNLASNYGTVIPGSNPPASPIIGRYAYVMYDEGALLDANVAGYLSSATNTASSFPAYTNSVTGNIQTLYGKSYLAYADLTQLPGFNVTGGQTNIDNFVKWRNAGGLAGATTGPAFLGAAYTNAANGFLTSVPGDSPLVGRQDLINYFASIDPNLNTSSATSSRALPYLGTFSRDANTPSYYPTTDSAGITNYYSGSTQTNLYYGTSTSYGYRTSMETAGYPNRDLANVRYPISIAAATPVTHYDDTAASHTYTVNPGDPALQSRFSLAKISWLSQTWAGQADPGTDNPSYAGSKYPAAIQACFGLVRDYPAGVSGTEANGGNKCWNYVGSTTPVSSASGLQTVTSVKIETLDQVAAEGREPNFFELLKAAILNGSLGKSPGLPAWNNGQLGANPADPYDNNSKDANTPPYALSGSSDLFAYSFDGHTNTAGTAPTAFASYQYPDCQIIQIGANIIDQFDSDSFPTAIYFKYGGEGTFDSVRVGNTANGAPNCPIYGPVNIFYGDENLPELYALFMDVCSAPAASGGGAFDVTMDGWTAPGGGTTNLSAWVQPELWNPHQQPNTALFPSTGQKYEMRAYGALHAYWSWQGGSPPPPGWSAKLGFLSSTVWYTGNASSEANAAGTVFFTDATNTSSFYANPQILTTDSNPTAATPAVTVPVGTGSGLTDPKNVAQSTYPYYSLSPTNHFAAFYAGSTAPNNSDPTHPEFYTETNNAITPAFKFFQDNICGGGSAPLYCNSYALGWVDSKNPPGFHPYSFMTGTYCQEAGTYLPGGGVNHNGSVNPRNPSEKLYGYDTVDCRTTRLPQHHGDVNNGSHIELNTTTLPAPLYAGHRGSRDVVGLPYNPYNSPSSPHAPGYGYYVGTTPPDSNDGIPQDYSVNSTWQFPMYTPMSGPTTYPQAFYADPDGVVRPGDGFYANNVTGDAMQLYGSAAAPTGTSAAGDNGGNVSHGRRPVILNRPFRSVGELGFTFRDLPFKTLDFFSQSSADAALLDVFSITDEAVISNNKINAMVAGHVNLSNASLPVLKALLNNGAKKTDFDPTFNMSGETSRMSTNIGALVSPTNIAPFGPLLNRASIVTTLMAGNALPATSAPGAISILGSFTNSVEMGNKPYFEAPVRALAGVTNTRTWNLMIDVIAQSGHLVPNATSLDNFVVDGERRYWLHIAIDRYTGKIIDQQLEPVYE